MAITTLIDGDIIPYSCGFASQVSTYETEDGEVHATPTSAKKHIELFKLDSAIVCRVEAEPVSHALRLAKNLLLRVKEATNADDLKVFLTGVGNFRIKVATMLPYKGNRKRPKPLHYKALRKYLIEHWDAEVIDGMEADDMLAIEQMKVINGRAT